MKKVIYLLMLILSVSITSATCQGQPPKGNRAQMREQVRSMKIAYITDALKLTPEESQQFWPLYNKYWEERSGKAHAKRDLYRRIESQQATEVQLKDIFKNQKEEHDIMERYAEQFKKILSIDKVAKLFVAEESFKNFLLRKASIDGKK